MRQQPQFRVVTVQLDAALEVSVESFDSVDWHAIQRWLIPTDDDESARVRRHEVEASAASSGWELPTGRWPRASRAGRRVLHPVRPANWHTIVAGATAYRRQLMKEFAAQDQAWRHLIRDSVTAGDLNPVGAAEAAEVSRWRIYQLMKDPTHTDETVKIAEATVQQQRNRTLGTPA